MRVLVRGGSASHSPLSSFVGILYLLTEGRRQRQGSVKGPGWRGKRLLVVFRDSRRDYRQNGPGVNIACDELQSTSTSTNHPTTSP